MLNTYRTLLKPGIDEIVIEKSKFIGYSSPVSSIEEAVAFIENIKTKHWDATHNVYAYVFGDRNEIQRYSDDGEPSGTAGIPVLEVIKKEDLRNVAVVVTRYFGGVKLGAGGLVRAYTKAAKIGIDAGQMITKRRYTVVYLKIEYTLLGKIQNEILQNGYYIRDTQYDDAVHFYIYVKSEEVENFKGSVVEWTNGRCQIDVGEEEYLSEKNGKIIDLTE